MAITAHVVSSEVCGGDKSIKKYTVYKIVVEYGQQSWVFYRRYNEFSKLCDSLKKQYPYLHLKLPGKKLFGNNFSTDFIRSRRQGLDTLVQRIFAEPQLLDLTEVRDFFQFDNSLKNSMDDEEDDENSQTNSFDSNNSDSKITINLGPSEKSSCTPSDFQFLRMIGKGSFGKVYSARHLKEDKIYAVKVLYKKMILKTNEKNHIMSERNVLLKNLNHPFLVGLHYSFQTKDKLYFVLDYVNGGELFFHLSKERAFTEQRARFYAAEITSAIGYLHSQGTIYRDLKPENILLDSEGHIVLTDFGLCKEGRETTNTFCGTPEYLAPEVLRKEAYDRCVDWWCLGAVLFEMLNGLPPFYSRDNAEMSDNILHKPVRLRANISASTRNIIESLLQKDKRRRLGAIEDAEEVKRHEFFKPINWIDLENKRIPPPFNPNVRDNYDLRNIDPEFVRESIPNSVMRNGIGTNASLNDNAFQGFSYVPAATITNF
ncbi:serine/threonine-protein kinase Sgk2-like [Dermatophagoides pteronyssinus]|uniref:serine/threonine-protein kinase Sgk2-like n=1 Tax=Dermatophagoides pteronyssinus TaxID=6956 RepID=UPI003F66965C